MELAFGGTFIGSYCFSSFHPFFIYDAISIWDNWYHWRFYIAAAEEQKVLGTWAIGIGAVSIIVGIFILPFF